MGVRRSVAAGPPAAAHRASEPLKFWLKSLTNDGLIGGYRQIQLGCLGEPARHPRPQVGRSGRISPKHPTLFFTGAIAGGYNSPQVRQPAAWNRVNGRRFIHR
jgi:hypothetical protein